MKKILLIMLLGMMVYPAILSAKPLIYVLSGTANNIVVIDLGSDTIIGQIKAG